MKTFLPTRDPLKGYITKSKSLERLSVTAAELPKRFLQEEFGKI